MNNKLLNFCPDHAVLMPVANKIQYHECITIMSRST